MSLRFNQFVNNVKGWGLRTGNNLREFYEKTRTIAQKAKPILEKTSNVAENVNRHAQRLLTDPGHKQAADWWTSRLKKFSQDYNRLLHKSERIRDVILEPST